jgi:signal transduction histidine kinase
MRKPGGSAWERWSDLSIRWIAYATLAIGTGLTLPQSILTATTRYEILALAIGAAIWTYLMYTRIPDPKVAHQARMRIYFAGFLVFCGLLMAIHPQFFVYAIAGLFHASQLRPTALVFVGIGLTSTLINTITTAFPWQSFEQAALFGSLIVLQTAVIGAATVAGEKLAEVSAQRREAVAKLEAALEENAGLHQQLLVQAREAGVLDERQRIAREIHDTIAHDLTGIVTQLEAATQARVNTDDWSHHVASALQLARAGLTEARRSVQAYRPAALEGTPLSSALADEVRKWSTLNGVSAEVKTTGEEVPLHEEVEVALLRTAQEALANIAKHARAKKAVVTLSYIGDVVTLDVRDDGVGFRLDEPRNENGTGFGLTTMRQRVNRVAGTLEIESEPGGGTAISARVPSLGAPQIGVRP